MRSGRSVAIALAVGAISSGPALASVVPASGDPVLFWNDVLLDAVRAAGTAPPVAARGMALVNVAMHDAVNATLGRPYQDNLGRFILPRGDTRTAASVAAHDVLADLYPAQISTFDAALATSLALMPAGSSKSQGARIGAATAAAAIARRQDDGWDAVVTYTPSSAPGRWQPTPPAYANPALPHWGNVDPWVMTSASQFRAPPPPALDSAEYAAAYNEVKELGAATSTTRTADQTNIALYWADGAGTATPPGHWLSIAIDVATAQQLSTIQNARLFGLMAISMADAAIAAWETKYHYDFWRPVTAIRAGDQDSNAATDADPAWDPLIATPPFPAYPSGHSTFSAAAGRILALTLGDDYDYCSPQDGTATPITRCWGSFSEAVAEAGRSRIYGGIHWPFDDRSGQATGRAIADLAFASFFWPIPEPGALGLFMLGAAVVLAARRRHSRDAEGCPRTGGVRPAWSRIGGAGTAGEARAADSAYDPPEGRSLIDDLASDHENAAACIMQRLRVLR